MDLHQKEIQGFFNFPVDNLRASPFLIQYIQEEVRPPYYCAPNGALLYIIDRLCFLRIKCNFNTSISFFSQIPDYRNAIIVAKSPSAAKR